MHFLSYSLFFVACFIGYLNGQTFHVGNCPNRSVKEDFDQNKFLGTWHEYSKNRRAYGVYELGLRCATETYIKNFDGSIRMVNKGSRITFGAAYSEEMLGYMSNPGEFTFNFPGLPYAGSSKVPLHVMDTDYENYAVVWSCSDRAGMNAQVIKILTREAQPEPEVVRKALRVLDENRINRLFFVRTPQYNCGTSRDPKMP